MFWLVVIGVKVQAKFYNAFHDSQCPNNNLHRFYYSLEIYQYIERYQLFIYLLWYQLPAFARNSVPGIS